MYSTWTVSHVWLSRKRIKKTVIPCTEKHIRINKQWLHEFLSRRRFYWHFCALSIPSDPMFYCIGKHDKDFYFAMSPIRIDNRNFFSRLWEIVQSMQHEFIVINSESSGGARKIPFKLPESRGQCCLHLLHVFTKWANIQPIKKYWLKKTTNDRRKLPSHCKYFVYA